MLVKYGHVVLIKKCKNVKKAIPHDNARIMFLYVVSATVAYREGVIGKSTALGKRNCLQQ